MLEVGTLPETSFIAEIILGLLSQSKTVVPGNYEPV